MSMKTGLSDIQCQALGRLDIEKLNAMQLAALELCRKSGSMVLLSPTGTGKTLAFLLPLLERIDPSCNKVQAVIVLPSRELAYRFHLMLSQMSNHWRTSYTYHPHMNTHSTPSPMHSPMVLNHCFGYSHVLCWYNTNCC